MLAEERPIIQKNAASRHLSAKDAGRFCVSDRTFVVCLIPFNELRQAHTAKEFLRVEFGVPGLGAHLKQLTPELSGSINREAIDLSA
ncbi:MAG: hypothetical protein DDT34_02503 [Firmicutes bacterium]|nr:hypothetical protein [Bacillota bacterium]